MDIDFTLNSAFRVKYLQVYDAAGAFIHLSQSYLSFLFSLHQYILEVKAGICSVILFRCLRRLFYLDLSKHQIRSISVLTCVHSRAY